MTLDPFRSADNWTDCPECEESFGWNDEDGLEGQECYCGHVFRDEDDERVVAQAATKVAPGPRSRPSAIAERAFRGRL